jgi:hypothetical protein
MGLRHQPVRSKQNWSAELTATAGRTHKTMSSNKYSEEDCIESLQEAAEQLGHPPSLKEYKSIDTKVSVYYIRKCFGSWSSAKQESGLDECSPGRKNQYNKEDCIDSIKEAAEILGRSPTHREYDKLDILPSTDTIQRTVGSWNKAKEQANLRTYTEPRYGTPPKWQSYTQEEWENLSHSTRTKSRKQSVVSNIKVDRGCYKCGYSKSPSALSFHHINPDTKDSPVSTMLATGESLNKIMEEIGKCRVLCANCHREKHYG